jgi:hypothetical protein
MGGSSREGAYLTAQCRASMPDLRAEEFRETLIINPAIKYTLPLHNERRDV